MTNSLSRLWDQITNKNNNRFLIFYKRRNCFYFLLSSRLNFNTHTQKLWAMPFDGFQQFAAITYPMVFYQSRIRALKFFLYRMKLQTPYVMGSVIPQFSLQTNLNRTEVSMSGSFSTASTNIECIQWQNIEDVNHFYGTDDFNHLRICNNFQHKIVFEWVD